VFGFEQQSNHDSAHPQGKKKRTHSKAGGSQQGHRQQTQNGAGGHKHGNGHAHGHGNNGLHGHRAYGQVSKNIRLEQPLEAFSSPGMTLENVKRVVYVVFGVTLRVL
jgi:hypothetical protein